MGLWQEANGLPNCPRPDCNGEPSTEEGNVIFCSDCGCGPRIEEGYVTERGAFRGWRRHVLRYKTNDKYRAEIESIMEESRKEYGL